MINNVLIQQMPFLAETVQITAQGMIQVVDKKKLQDEAIGKFVYQAVFGKTKQQALACWLIWELGQALGIYPASIHEFYRAG